jgi:hypothetical protein
MAVGNRNPQDVSTILGVLLFGVNQSELLIVLYSPIIKPVEVYNPDKLRFVGDQVS